jgi:hypothetical protein
LTPAQKLRSTGASGFSDEGEYILKFLLLLGVLTSPIYLLPSGSVQIYHLLLAVMSVLTFVSTNMLRYNNTTILAIVLAYYIIIRQCIYLLGHPHEMATLLYPLLNTLVFLGVFRVLSTFSRPGEFRLVAFAIGATAAFELAYILLQNPSIGEFLGNERTVRSIGTFNNPNQLGYFSVLTGCAFVALRKQAGISAKMTFAVVFVSISLAVYSLSKAAMVAISPLIILAILEWKNEIRSRLLRSSVNLTALLIAVGAVILLMSHFDAFVDSDNQALRRLGRIGMDNDDNLESRGYALIVNPDARILFGYGEGYYKRLYGHEIHSTLANVLTSYGVVGFWIFSLFILSILQHRLISLHACLLGLVFAYGLTHNGFRNTLFWVFLAILASSAEHARAAYRQRY